MELVKDFCDRELPFEYLKENSVISQSYLTCSILSDVLERLTIDEYAFYVEFNYSNYKENFRWEFEKKSLLDYSDLIELPHFERLTLLIVKIFSTKKLLGIEKRFLETPQNEILKSNASKDEYILAVPILNLLYDEFNGKLWEEISLVEFLNVFTTTISPVSNLKILHKTRFYYLLKKIWINGYNLSLFQSEKEWIEPFSNNHKLSKQVYWNQTVANEKANKHRDFIRQVDKILPKDELI